MARKEIIHTPIGVIHSSFISPESTPLQSAFAGSSTGEVVLFPEFGDGLKDIDSFSHIILIYQFHLSRGYSLISRTCLGDEEHGIFSMRQSKRPNAIGISFVSLERVRGNTLEISGVDIVDGSPLLDIKPFVPLFDNRPGCLMGWLSKSHADRVREESILRAGRQPESNAVTGTRHSTEATRNIEPIKYSPIGLMHSGFTNTRSAPIQGVFARDARGQIEVYPEYARGLSDIQGFSHLIVLYHFHLARGYNLITMPFLEDEKHGIFSIRHFKRPNAIGISVVKLENVRGNILELSEVDIIDGTPIIDIKPFVPVFDNILDASDGWLSNPHIDLVRGESDRHRPE